MKSITDIRNLIEEQKNFKKKKININNISIIKYFNYYKNRIIKFFKQRCFIPFYFSYFFYGFSLEGCFRGEDLCSRKVAWMISKVIEEIISCIIMAIMIQLILFKKISRYHFIHIIICFFIFFAYSHGFDFPDHGYFNFFYYFILLLIFTILIMPFSLMIYFIKINKKIIIYLIIFVIFSIFLFPSFFVFIYLPSNCQGWEKGLNNTIIDNNLESHGCQITIPKKCGFKSLKRVQDYTKIIGKNCTTYKLSNSKQNILKSSTSPYITGKVNKIGFPLTNKDSICFLDFKEDNNYIQKYVYSNLVDMENDYILEQFFKDRMPEITVDFTNNTQGKMIINVNYNESLSKERKLLEKHANPYSDNILILYIDSVSRANALRQLKKTMSFFEKFISYKGGFNEKYPSEIFHSFQFFKYYSFIGYTVRNYPYIFYGQNREDENITLITKHLKNIGYITSNAHDYCDKDNTRTLHNITKEEMYDHQFIICDPNNDHINLNTIRCLYGKQSTEHLYEYTSKFWKKYKYNRKYASIITNNGHEGTLTVLKYIDEIIYNFLNNLFNDNLLKDSSVILLSDHGAGMPSIYYLFDFYSIEINLPMLFIIINDRKNISYEIQYNVINKNQQSFITGFDIYNTFGNLAFGDEYFYFKNKSSLIETPKSEYGISLFEKINSKKRFPKLFSYINDISEISCK